MCWEPFSKKASLFYTYLRLFLEEETIAFSHLLAAEPINLLPALYSESLPFDTGRWHVSSKAGPSHLLSVPVIQVIYVLFPPSE